MQSFDVVILGAGAAGLFAGAEAARRGRRVLIIDHAKAAGKKIRISGGGRCNFTNLNIRHDRFLSKNPMFALSALKRFTQHDFIARVNEAKIPWHEKALGQLFCDGSAVQITQMLLRDYGAAEGTLWLETEIHAVHPSVGGFELNTTRGRVGAASVVVALGGKSIPKMGATGLGYKIAKDFTIPLVETRPALVPLTFGELDLEALSSLSGLSVAGRVSTGNIGFDDGVLFTHRGLSGPAVLQISSYWREGLPISLDTAHGQNVGGSLREMRSRNGKIALQTALGQFLPEKLARMVAVTSGLLGNLADQNNQKLDHLAVLVHGWRLTPVGSEGYRTAEVTLGGVNTDALDAKTMQVKSCPGLYFIGEVVDVTGWLGGYNFQWAWSSGWVAGQVA
jgi:predicted Rossmann fold flavoprotein